MGSELHDTEIELARKRILDGDNSSCFIERETVIKKHLGEAMLLPEERRYTFSLRKLAEELSTPIEDEDVLIGRMLEGRLGEGESRATCPGGLNSVGHVTLDWPELLSKGLNAIAAEAMRNARLSGKEEALSFAENAGACITAAVTFASRYAEAAGSKASWSEIPQLASRFSSAAAALCNVPAKPARSFHEALQSIWFVHLVTSCLIGSRDFAFGRMDQYLFPYYKNDIDSGVLDRKGAVALLSALFIKSNEITGTATWNHQPKPIPSNASKQYLIIGGSNMDGSTTENELSYLIMDAAELVKMPQPVITVRLAASSGDAFKVRVTKAVAALGSQIHIFNDNIIIPSLIKRGITKEDAYDYSMVGCCRLNIPGKMDWGSIESFHNLPLWLLKTMHRENLSGQECEWRDWLNYSTFEDLMKAFAGQCRKSLEQSVDANRQSIAKRFPKAFHFESLLLSDCIRNSTDYINGGVRYRPQNHYLGGIATVVDSLAAIRKIVFEERRFTLQRFMEIVRNDFRDDPRLRHEILQNAPKFGNGEPAADQLASEIGNMLLDILYSFETPERQPLLSGFYSLDQHHGWGGALPATPDGRLRGEPVSENQSPVYGADKSGVTALLKSVTCLPLDKTAMGGLNIKFGSPVRTEIIGDLLTTFFRSGGIHAGFSLADRKTLEDAAAKPGNYRSLCVRMYGFSEYFTSLSAREQAELISRTEY
jgi:formate C-acetyltransferase